MYQEGAGQTALDVRSGNPRVREEPIFGVLGSRGKDVLPFPQPRRCEYLRAGQALGPFDCDRTRRKSRRRTHMPLDEPRDRNAAASTREDHQYTRSELRGSLEARRKDPRVRSQRGETICE
jgi:hypothetical protein